VFHELLLSCGVSLIKYSRLQRATWSSEIHEAFFMIAEAKLRHALGNSGVQCRLQENCKDQAQTQLLIILRKTLTHV